jgi:hypothetical protein
MLDFTINLSENQDTVQYELLLDLQLQKNSSEFTFAQALVESNLSSPFLQFQVVDNDQVTITQQVIINSNSRI